MKGFLKAVCPLLFLALAGCAHFGRAPARSDHAQPAQPAPLLPLESGDVDGGKGSADPGGSEEYYVGSIADPDDPDLIYRPGKLIVERTGGRYLPGGDEPVRDGPQTVGSLANFHPDPTETELGALVARSQRAMAALTERNERLEAQVKALGAAAVPGVAVAAKASPPLPAAQPNSKANPAPAADEARLNVVTPNADNVIELDPNFFVGPSPTTDNPFVQLYQPPVSLREISILVSAAVPGPAPSAIIDNVPYGIGDQIRGLTVYRVDKDAVYLRKDSFLLACPVSERAITIRIP